MALKYYKWCFHRRNVSARKWSKMLLAFARQLQNVFILPLFPWIQKGALWPDAGMESGPILTKSCPKSGLSSFFSLKESFFIIAQKVGKHLGYFCYKIRCQDRSKVAQSGLTGGGGSILFLHYSMICVMALPF